MPVNNAPSVPYLGGENPKLIFFYPVRLYLGYISEPAQFEANS